MEDRVDGCQADVFVAATIAGDEMRIEHFVVVGRRIVVVTDAGVRIGSLSMQNAEGVAICARSGVVGDIVQECVTGADSITRQ